MRERERGKKFGVTWVQKEKKENKLKIKSAPTLVLCARALGSCATKALPRNFYVYFVEGVERYSSRLRRIKTRAE